MARDQQPAWHCVTNLGDAAPFEHGGKFLMIDRRGFYPAELWVFSEWQEESPTITLHRIVLEHCHQFRDAQGDYHLGDNTYHPHQSAWFGGKSQLKEVASFIGMDPVDFRRLFCRNAYDRAIAYDAVASYFGLTEFDQYPRTFDTKREAKAFCRCMLAQIKKSGSAPGWLPLVSPP